jgi:hypothetical protein
LELKAAAMGSMILLSLACAAEAHASAAARRVILKDVFILCFQGQEYFLKISEVLIPPNAKLFDMT